MSVDWRQIAEILPTLSYAVVLLGVPVGLWQYYQTSKKERLDREYGTYSALDDRYLEFLRLCFDHPRLDIFDVADKEPRELTGDERKRQLIAFTILISIFERAYLMYCGHSDAIRARQWTGWEQYISAYCKRPNFKEAWERSGVTFDSEFEREMKARLSRSEMPL